MNRKLRLSFLVVALGYILLARQAVAQSGWFWQNPLPQGNGLEATATVDANIVYGVGRAGTILRSDDGGLNWTIQMSNTRHLLEAISCTDANTCTAVGFSGTILRTTNGGATWTIESSGGQVGLLAVSFKDANTGTVVGESGTILHTTDGGTTWTPQSSGTSGPLFGVSCIDVNTCTAVGEKILRTTNGGVTWTPQSSGTSDIFRGISCPDANTCTAVTFGAPGAVLHTTNGGMNWNIQTTAAANLYGVSCPDASTCTVVGSGLSGTILRTTDGGATWTRQSNPTQTVLVAVSFINADTGMIAVAAPGTVLRTTDGGATWNITTPTYVATFDPLYGVSCTDSDTCTAVGGAQDFSPPFATRGTIVRTTNGGATWTAQSNSATNILRGVSCADQNVCTVVGDQGTILRTTNGGATWTTQSSGTTDRLAGVSCPDANTCTAVGGRNDATSPYGTLATILRTNDGGATWIRQDPSLPDDPIAELFGVSFTDANTGTAVGAHFAIVRTFDGGAFWDDESLGTTLSLLSVSMTDVETGMAATDRSILRSSPLGTPWTPVFGEGAHSISCTDANTCTAVGFDLTVGNKILRTTDGGATWAHQPNPAATGLFGVSCTDANMCTAVGEDGTILRTNTGGQ